MIVKEFEGKNEKEAIDKAIEELGLDRNEIDFEIVEAKKPGILFRGGKVKIRVHLLEEHEEGEEYEEEAGPDEGPPDQQGKTLEALQFIVNLAAGRMGEETTRIVLDTQDYRSRRERSLIRMANQIADQVRRSRESQLLEPLNPFERRLIHTSLARYGDIETVSEGDGLYKRIRVIWRSDRDGRRE